MLTEAIVDWNGKVGGDEADVALCKKEVMAMIVPEYRDRASAPLLSLPETSSTVKR